MSKLSQLVALLAVLSITLLVAGSASAREVTRLSAKLGGKTEAPRSADSNGRGWLSMTVRPDRRRVCFELRHAKIGKPTGIDLRRGPRGSGGPVEIRLLRRKKGVARPVVKRCKRRVSPRPLRDVALRPNEFHLSVRSRSSPRGAIRGQLDRAVGGFEEHGLGDFDLFSTSNGSLNLTRERAYQGSRSAQASNLGSGLQYQRVWYDVDWAEGTNVWYGMAIYIPRLADWCFWHPIRWDNHKQFESGGDIGGLRVERGMLYLDGGGYQHREQLAGPVPLPEARWFWVEVRQRLSGDASGAVSEVFIDGRRVMKSTAANMAGRPISTIRFGNVAMASHCSGPSNIYFDRVSISHRERGPLSRRSG